MGASFPPGLMLRDIRQKTSNYVAVTRQRSIPDGETTATGNTLNSRMRCAAPAMADITDIVLSYPGWGLAFVGTATTEQDYPQAYTVTASIEYPVGTFTPVFTGASRTLAVTPGRASYNFDPAPVRIPAGATFYVKTFVSWATGALPLGRWIASYTTTEWSNWGTGLADNTLTATTFTNSTFVNYVAGFGPSVFGRVSRVIPVLGLLGDSILEGVTIDQGDPFTGAVFVERAMRGQIPVINLCRYGESGSGYLNRQEGRAALLRSSVTDIVCDYGRNDIASGSSLATAQAMIQNVCLPWMNRGVRVSVMTALPSVTSSDVFATRGNMALYDATHEPVRLLYNTWLRANWQSLGFTRLIDMAAIVDPTSSGLWNADGPGNYGTGGFATLAGGVVTAVAPGLYNSGNSSGGGFPPSTTVPCWVQAYPGDPGSGAVVVANINGAGQATTYTVTAGGSGYQFPPMVSPRAAWTGDGIHPNHYGCNQIISQGGVGPAMFGL